MNFSPDNQQGLIGLIEALKHGMDPNTAYGFATDIQNQQAQQVAQRQARLSGLADLLTTNAQNGLPYGGAQALANAQPGPSGPAVQNILASLYPTAGQVNTDVTQPPSPGALAPSDYLSGQALQHEQQQMQARQASVQSPTYTPDPMAQLQLQQQQASTIAAVNAAQMEPAWAVFQADAAQAKSEGNTPDQFVARVIKQDPANAQLLASDPARVKAILQNTFGTLAVSYSGAPTG